MDTITGRDCCRQLIFTILLFLSLPCTCCNGQLLRNHSDYLKAALQAPTPEESIAFGQKACRLAIKEHQFKTAIVYCFQLSNTFFQQQHYIHGIRQAQKGLSIASRYKVDSDTLLFKNYSLLAALYSRLPMNDSASFWYNQAEKMLRPESRLFRLIPEFVDAHYYNQAFFFVRLGDQERAVSSVRKSIEMAEKKGDKRSIALSYQQLANTYFLSYQYADAANYYRNALAGFNSESVDMCWGYAFLGNCLRADGKLDEGLRWLRLGKEKYSAIITISPSKKDIDFEIESSYYLGKCEQLMGLDKTAQQSFEASVTIHQHHYGVKGEFIAASWSGLAAIALKQQKFTEALGSVQQALIASALVFSQKDIGYNPETDDIKSGKPLYEALRLKGLILFQVYKKEGRPSVLNQAIQTYFDAMQVAQRIRRSFSQLESTYFFNEKIQPCVANALDAIYELSTLRQGNHPVSMAFDLLQSYQSMGMNDALYNKAIKQATIPIEVLQQEQELRQKLVAASKQLLDTMTVAHRQRVVKQISAVKRQLHLFEDTTFQQYSRYYALKYDNQRMSIDELQAKLADRTAYVSYFMSKDYLYGFCATKKRSMIFRRVIGPTFSHTVRALRKSLEIKPGMFDYDGRPAASQLFDYLIKPIEPYITDVDRLIVERDDILNTIPFEILEPREKPEAYLCRRLALSYSYSAKLALSSSTAKTIIHPVGFAPYSKDLRWRQKIIASSRLLPKSAEEIQVSGGVAYLNGQATKTRFYQAIPTANLLHLATHAMANDLQPEASSIGFYPNEPDSLLRSLEIVNLPLDSVRLIVLSACEGNRGVLRKAEGVLSLARSFRLAGCPTILTTTWEAHNETTAELIKLFYSYLHQGLPADVALHKARMDYFASPFFKRWGHPYYWANFSLIGNPQVTFLPTSSRQLWLLWAVAVAILLGLLGIWLWRRQSTAEPIARPYLPPNLPTI